MNDLFARIEQLSKQVHRLLDMEVKEVSLVDRAANRRRFLLIKREEGMETPIGDEVIENENGELTTEPESVPEDVDKAMGPIPKGVKDSVLKVATEALSKLMGVVNKIKDAPTTDEQIDQPIPAELMKECEAIGKLIMTIGEKYPSPTSGRAADTAKAEGAEPESTEPETPADPQAPQAADTEKAVGAENKVCVCAKCGYEEVGKAGEMCTEKVCPKCGAKMARKGVEQEREDAEMRKALDEVNAVADELRKALAAFSKPAPTPTPTAAPAVPAEVTTAIENVSKAVAAIPVLSQQIAGLSKTVGEQNQKIRALESSEPMPNSIQPEGVQKSRGEERADWGDGCDLNAVEEPDDDLRFE